MTHESDIKSVAARLADALGPERQGKVFIGIRVAGTLVNEQITEEDTIICYVSEDYAGHPDLIEVFEGHVIEFKQAYVKLREPEVGLTWTGVPGVDYERVA